MPASPSSITTQEDLRESIINKNIFPIYLFHGNEAYLIDEMTVLLIGQILNDTDEDNQNKTVKQLTDLALLSQNLLKGEALTVFIKRSLEIIK